LEAGSLVRVCGKFWAEDLPSRKEFSVHSPREMAIPPPKIFRELAHVPNFLVAVILIIAN